MNPSRVEPGAEAYFGILRALRALEYRLCSAYRVRAVEHCRPSIVQTRSVLVPHIAGRASTKHQHHDRRRGCCYRRQLTHPPAPRAEEGVEEKQKQSGNKEDLKSVGEVCALEQRTLFRAQPRERRTNGRGASGISKTNEDATPDFGCGPEYVRRIPSDHHCA